MNIGGEAVNIDRDAGYEILSALSELHGRICKKVSECGCMEESTMLSLRLLPIVRAYNKCEEELAHIEVREPRFLDIP